MPFRLLISFKNIMKTILKTRLFITFNIHFMPQGEEKATNALKIINVNIIVAMIAVLQPAIR